jgi:hypothetical protein
MKPKAEADQPINESPVEPTAIPRPESESSTESPVEDAPVKKPAYKPRFVPPKRKED